MTLSNTRNARRAVLTAILCLAALIALPCCNNDPDLDPQPGELGQWVDPFIGTGGLPWASGMLSPCAIVPFGTVRLGPDTTHVGGLTIGNWGTSGYFYGHRNTVGFSHTRLSGTGAMDGGHFRITPASGAVDPSTRLTNPIPLNHAHECASPGYYSAWLQKPDIVAEMSATTHVGAHRYTFRSGETAHLMLDATSHVGDKRAENGWVKVLSDDREVIGSGAVFGAFSGRYGGLMGYFVARFSEPFDGFGTWLDGVLVEGRDEIAGDDVGVDLRFDAGRGETVVEVKLGMSFVSLENARENLEAEAGGLDFDGVRDAAREVWETELGRVLIETPEPAVREIFTTSLYHCMVMPTNFTDVNGEYLGFHDQIGVAEGFTYYTDLSLWDTFRSEHPLLILMSPQVQLDSVKSLIEMARIGGGLPRWPSGAGYTGSMIDSPANQVIAESYLKGLTDFDAEAAYEYMKLISLGPAPEGVPGRAGNIDCLEYGYCPADLMNDSVSRTLEYAWADASISLLGEALGYAGEAEFFWDRALDYRLIWNPETAYFQPRNADGSWVVPLLPNMTTYYDEIFGNIFVGDYVEGSPRHWRWVAPHDPEGLLELFGDPEYFTCELETFMEEASPRRGDIDPGPAYWHGNQHDMHAIYLFDEAGRPDLTQKYVRWALTDRYGTEPDGLDGNDDGGTLSAWYVLSAMGFYAIAGTDRYWVGAPIVDRADVVVDGETTLTVIAENQGPENLYVQEASINGMRLCEPFFVHDQIPAGSTILFEMGPEPAAGGGFACP